MVRVSVNAAANDDVKKQPLTTNNETSTLIDWLTQVIQYASQLLQLTSSTHIHPQQAVGHGWLCQMGHFLDGSYWSWLSACWTI